MANNQANIKAVITAEDKSKSVLSGFSNNVSSIGSQIVGIAKTASVALGAATTAAVGFAVKSAANFEQTRIGLENMLGSADKARAVLAEVSKFAADTPFEFPELAQATRQLVAFGFNGEDAVKTMKQLGDVSAAVGAPINDLAYLMGTLKTQGRAFTIDIRQFAQRGIPIYEYLSKVLKTNEQALTGMIEAGKVGFPEVQKAFELMTKEGGKFHGTMARQSKSLNGLFSTLKDNIGQTARELVGITAEGDIKEGSVFARLRDAVGWLIERLPTLIEQMKQIVRDILPQMKQWADNVIAVGEAIGTYLAPKLEALWNSVVTKLLPALTNLWKDTIEPMIPVIGTALVGAFGLLIDALNLLVTVATPIINFLARHNELVWGAVAAITAWYAVMKVNTAFTVVSNGLTLMSAQLTAVTAQTGGLMGALTVLNTSLSTFAGFGIFAAAATAAFLKVKSEIDELNSILDHTNESIKKRDINTYVKTYNDIKEKRGIEAAHRYAEMQSRALGGAVTAGRAYQVGERGKPEMFVPNQNGRIINDQDLKKMGGNQSVENKTTINMSVSIGMYAGGEQEKRRIAEEIFRAAQDVAKMRGLDLSKMLAGTP